MRHSLISSLEQTGAQHGRDQQREQQRSQQGKGHGPRHGAEQAAFDALQGEDGQVGNDDDDAGEKYRLLHFVRRGADHLQKRFLALAELGVAQDVLDHDHRAIDHHAEIERAERKQVRRECD